MSLTANSSELVNQIMDIVQPNLNLPVLAGSTLIAAGLLTLLPTLIVIAVNALGFTAVGVLHGSIAALVQSVVYGGQTAGWFSVFQAFGATAAISSPAVIGIGGTMTALGAGLQAI